jgi:hypothetical protein
MNGKRVHLVGAALLDQFAAGGWLPLYVAEGAPEQKRRSIGTAVGRVDTLHTHQIRIVTSISMNVIRSFRPRLSAANTASH